MLVDIWKKTNGKWMENGKIRVKRKEKIRRMMAGKYTPQTITPKIRELLKQFMPSENEITLGNYALDFSHTYKIIKFTPKAIITEMDGRRYLIKVEKWTDNISSQYVVYTEGRRFQEQIKI